MNYHRISYVSDVANVLVWNTQSGKKLSEITIQDMVTSFDFSPDGKTIITDGVSLHDRRYWDVESGKETQPQRPSPPLNTQTSTEPSNGTVLRPRQTTVVRGTVPGVEELRPGISQGLRFGVGAADHPGSGVYVTHVLPNSPGDLAGFVAGDVILEINGTPIFNLQDYSQAIDDSPETMNTTVVNLNNGRIHRTVELKY